MSYLHQLLSEENTKFYVEVTAQDATRASQVYNDEPQFELYIDKDSPFRYVSNDLNMMITFLQRLGDRQIEITDSNVGEHMDDMESDFELEEKKGRDMDGDNDIDSDDYLLTRDQAIKNAMKGKKIKKSALKELVKKALQEQPMGMGQAKTGAVELPKATNPADIKKITDKGINVQLKEDDWMDPNDESDMAKSQLYKIGKYATGLIHMIKDGEQLDAWVQAKLTKAADYLGAVMHYLEGEKALGMNEGDIKVGDMIGNTVQGFDHKVLDIQGDHYIVQNTATGKKMKTFRDNMYKARAMEEGLGNDIMTLQAWLVKLNQTLAYEKREGGGKDLKQIAFLEKEIADAKAKLKEKLAQQKQGMNEAPSGQYYIKVNPRDYKKAVMLVNTSYPKANIEFNDPDTFYTPDIQTAEDLIMDFGTQDIEIVEDNLNDFGEYDSFDFEDDIEIYDLNPGLYENRKKTSKSYKRKKK
jgi:acetolactate synthase small subunit